MVIAAADGDYGNAGIRFRDLYAARANAVAFQIGFQKLAEFITADRADHIRLTVDLGNRNGLVCTLAAVGGHEVLSVNGFTELGQNIRIDNKVNIDAADNKNIFHDIASFHG
jgi:uncharacterized ubiquitin-like protein YukD